MNPPTKAPSGVHHYVSEHSWKSIEDLAWNDEYQGTEVVNAYIHIFLEEYNRLMEEN